MFFFWAGKRGVGGKYMAGVLVWHVFCIRTVVSHQAFKSRSSCDVTLNGVVEYRDIWKALWTLTFPGLSYWIETLYLMKGFGYSLDTKKRVNGVMKEAFGDGTEYR